jgi:hypothetical protein
VRAGCIALLAVVALGVSRAPAPGVAEAESRREARQASDPCDGAIVVSPRRASEVANHARDAAILPGPIVVIAPPRAVLGVDYRHCSSPPRLVEVQPRSRAPPLRTGHPV